MYSENEKIEKARQVIQKIAGGTNPLNSEPIGSDSFLNDTRLVRCFYFIAEVLDNVVKGTYCNHGGKLAEFFITPEQKSIVKFPDGKIGVNEFSKCVNLCIDLSKSKKLTGVELNKRLKKLGIINEENIENGKTRAAINENSYKYGVEAEKRVYNGAEYDMVVINDKGKKYLLDNIEAIMGPEQ